MPQEHKSDATPLPTTGGKKKLEEKRALHRFKVDLVEAFGANFVTKHGNELTNSIHFLDEQRLLYPVGKFKF